MGINWNVIQGANQQPKSDVIDQGKLQQAQIPDTSAPSGGDDFGALAKGIKNLISPSPTAYSNPNVGTGNAAQGQAQAQQQDGLSSALNQQTTLGSPQPVTQDMMNSPAFSTAKQAHDAAIQSGVTSSPIMTVVDFSKPANQPRMFVVDTSKNQVLGSTYVAQGSTPGFSNTPGSHQSSLGTFLTGDTYHSQSMDKDAMKIQGLDKGVNDNAFARGIVVHGGSYVGPDKQGTSWGCFAVPNGVAPSLIGLTKGGTIIHAYAPDKQSISNFGQTLTPQGQANLHNSLGQQGNQDTSNYLINQKQGESTNQTIARQHSESQQSWISADKNNMKNPHTLQPLADYAKQYNNPDLNHSMSAIAQNETGDWKNRGFNSPYEETTNAGKGRVAIGKYQILNTNIPSWTHEALGHPMTTQQFMKDPKAQEDTAAYMMNKYSQKYGPSGAARAWNGGEGAVGNTKNKDVNQYEKKFNKGFLQSKAGTQLSMAGGINQHYDNQELEHSPYSEMNQTPNNSTDWSDESNGDNRSDAMPFISKPINSNMPTIAPETTVNWDKGANQVNPSSKSDTGMDVNSNAPWMNVG